MVYFNGYIFLPLDCDETIFKYEKAANTLHWIDQFKVENKDFSLTLVCINKAT